MNNEKLLVADKYSLMLSDLKGFVHQNNRVSFEKRYRLIMPILISTEFMEISSEKNTLIHLCNMIFSECYAKKSSAKFILLREKWLTVIISYTDADFYNLGLEMANGFFEIYDQIETLNDASLSKDVSYVLNWIEAKVYDQVSPMSLYAELGVNGDNLNKKVKKEVGESVNQLIIQQKVTEGKNLLRYSKMSIHEIALILGFYDSSHFSRTFKKLTGESPSSFRRRVPFSQLTRKLITEHVPSSIFKKSHP